MTRRRLSPAVIAAALLLTPSAAQAKKVHFSGHSTRDPSVLISFDAVGQKEIGRHGVMVPAKVKNIRVTNADYACGGPGTPTTSTRRSDLPFGSIGTLKVDKHGSFSGRYRPPSPPSLPNGNFSVTGSFRKGKALGSFIGFEGQNGVGLSCTTGGHRWVAKHG